MRLLFKVALFHLLSVSSESSAKLQCVRCSSIHLVQGNTHGGTMQTMEYPCWAAVPGGTKSYAVNTSDGTSNQWQITDLSQNTLSALPPYPGGGGGGVHLEKEHHDQLGYNLDYSVSCGIIRAVDNVEKQYRDTKENLRAAADIVSEHRWNNNNVLGGWVPPHPNHHGVQPEYWTPSHDFHVPATPATKGGIPYAVYNSSCCYGQSNFPR